MSLEKELATTEDSKNKISALGRLTKTEDIRNDEWLEWLRSWNELVIWFEDQHAYHYINYCLDIQDENKFQQYETWVNEYYNEYKKVNITLSQISQNIDNIGDNISDLSLTRIIQDWLSRIKTLSSITTEETLNLDIENKKIKDQYFEVTKNIKKEANKNTTHGSLSLDLLDSDRTVREHAWLTSRSLYDQNYDKLGVLFSQLVTNNHQKARAVNMDNYLEYRYLELNREYNTELNDQLANIIEDRIKPLYRKIMKNKILDLGLSQLKPWDLKFNPHTNESEKKFQHSYELIDKTIKSIAQIEPGWAILLNALRETDNWDLMASGRKRSGAFCSRLINKGLPFIFMNSKGSIKDIETFIHELGHGLHSLLVRNYEWYHSTKLKIDIAETSAMSLEMFFMEHLSIWFPEPSEQLAIKDNFWTDTVLKLLWYVTIDQFQLWVYRHPEATLEDYRTAWLSIFSRFFDTSDQPSLVDWSGLEDERSVLWLKQHHIFSQPLYFIEYAIGTLLSLQIWSLYLVEPDNIKERFTTMLQQGNNASLDRLIATMGLNLDFSASNPYLMWALIQLENQVTSNRKQLVQLGQPGSKLIFPTT